MKTWVKRAGDVMLLIGAIVLSAAVIGDVVGKLARVPLLWIAGGHLLLAGLVTGTVAWIFRLMDNRGGRVAVLVALLLIGAARWLRGTSGVRPDSPLLAAECIAVLLMWLAVHRRPPEVVPSAPEPENTGI